MGCLFTALQLNRGLFFETRAYNILKFRVMDVVAQVCRKIETDLVILNLVRGYKSNTCLS